MTVAAQANSAAAGPALRIAAAPFKASIVAGARRAARASAVAPAAEALAAVEPPGAAVVQEVVVAEDGVGRSWVLGVRFRANQDLE